MRVGTTVDYRRGVLDAVDGIVELERLGLDVVFLAEAYTYDAVSQLGYLAARTERVQLASAILQFYTRTPTLTAMTAAGLDYLSDGRFMLGLGASGPQVIEGFHGVRFDAPVQRTREVVEICRQVWRRERLEHDGRYYHIPLTEANGGTGLGKPLRLVSEPVRDRIPIMLAAMGPANVALAAEVADAWQPAFFHPERADAAFATALANGQARRGPDLTTLDVIASPALAIGSDPDAALARIRSRLAFSIGAMGPRGGNFYNDLARAYGYTDAATRIQQLFLRGERAAAEATVPEDLLRAVSLVGSAGEVRDRVAALAAAGVTTINAMPLADTGRERVRQIGQLIDLLR